MSEPGTSASNEGRLIPPPNILSSNKILVAESLQVGLGFVGQQHSLADIPQEAFSTEHAHQAKGIPPWLIAKATAMVTHKTRENIRLSFIIRPRRRGGASIVTDPPE